MPFQIIRNDIARVRADAIVNTANPRPRFGRGTDSAIYRAAGEEQLLAARRALGKLAPGEAAYTPAFALDARVIIHTVGPVWVDGRHGERDTLRACYANSLALADSLSCETIAFPLIASGSYGFPKDEALHIALSEIQRFLLTHEMHVTLVVFDRSAVELSESLVGAISQYIDDHMVQTLHERDRDMELPCAATQVNEPTGRLPRPRGPWRQDMLKLSDFFAPAESVEDEDTFFGEPIGTTAPMAAPRPDTGAGSAEDEGMIFGEAVYGAAAPAPLPDMSGKSLEEVLGYPGESFQQRLLRLIDERGLDDVSVYKKANIDRKLFSRIRCKPDYRPKKKTAVAFAIALELDLPTMTDLLSRAEIAFSPSNTFDLIITYFVTNGNYDIYEINAALFKYGQPILGE